MQTITRQSLTADFAPSVATWEFKCLKSSPVFNTLICGASPPDLQRELYDPLHPSWGHWSRAPFAYLVSTIFWISHWYQSIFSSLTA